MPETLQLITKTATKEFCKQGHALVGKNLYVHKGHNHCRICRRAALKRQRQKDPIYHAQRVREWRIELKIIVLSHYGNEKLQCCWPGCTETDIDVLTLDHVNNDGAIQRKERNKNLGTTIYSNVRKQGFPPGFQTLCANHQLKKEILRKRNGK